MKRSPRAIKKDLQELSLVELRQMEIWLKQLLPKAENTASPASKNTNVKIQVEDFIDDGKTYRLQYIRCGKETCKCALGELHGPYWYAYWFENGKTRSKYLGTKICP